MVPAGGEGVDGAILGEERHGSFCQSGHRVQSFTSELWSPAEDRVWRVTNEVFRHLSDPGCTRAPRDDDTTHSTRGSRNLASSDVCRFRVCGRKLFQ